MECMPDDHQACIFNSIKSTIRGLTAREGCAILYVWLAETNTISLVIPPEIENALAAAQNLPYFELSFFTSFLIYALILLTIFAYFFLEQFKAVVCI